eukprot:Pompholyxophrys_punicea_v1_NODE_1_length_14747_cov_12.267901.p15 type:complete len:102 gc:universal NODE_1_length_14747_cov_12.267901:1907-2212(+)
MTLRAVLTMPSTMASLAVYLDSVGVIGGVTGSIVAGAGSVGVSGSVYMDAPTDIRPSRERKSILPVQASFLYLCRNTKSDQWHLPVCNTVAHSRVNIQSCC